MTANRRLPFFPQWLIAGKEDAVPSGMRPFGGSPGDLAVDFRLAPRPDLITQLLAQCCLTGNDKVVDRRLLLELPVGMRIEALLALAALADPAPLTWRMRCGSSSCGKESEFQLTFEWIAEQVVAPAAAKRERPIVAVTIGKEKAILRRPTGLDQAEWLKQSGELEGEAMLRTILVRPGLEELLKKGETIESIALAVDKAMDSFDPLPGFHLGVVCPECSVSTEVFPDLTEAALERLSRAQHTAIEDVHRLASQYHWSERQILELPEWRRQSYLQLIEEGMAL